MTAEMRVGLDAVGEISVDCEKIKKKVGRHRRHSEFQQPVLTCARRLLQSKPF